MARIICLSPQISNMIAAGEVVERPGSVAKELIENSIDAGASRIAVEIKNGGVTYLRITDNGCGIDRDDVRVAFLRHATSKISSAADLDQIRTLGFRGEALAAVAAVSRVDMITRSRFCEEGTQITLDAGKEIDFVETGCPVGTTIVIRDLFFNIPARMKFLKKDATEGSYVEASLVHAALSRPDISFQFIRDGKTVITTPGDGMQSSAIHAIYGRETAEKMICTTSSASSGISVSGCVSPPDLTRSGRSLQCFFVNGRVVKSKVLSAALDEAYKNKLMHGRAPLCFLNLSMDVSQVDVNVHPAKIEVKFSQEKDVFRAVYHTVISALEANEHILSMGQSVIAAHEQVESKPTPDKGAAPYDAPVIVQTARTESPALSRQPAYIFPATHPMSFAPVARP